MLWIDTLGRVWETRRNANGTHDAKLLDADWFDKLRHWHSVDLRFMREAGFFRIP